MTTQQPIDKAEAHMVCDVQAYGTRMCATCWRYARESLDDAELRRLVALYPPAMAALHYLNDDEVMARLYDSGGDPYEWLIVSCGVCGRDEFRALEFGKCRFCAKMGGSVNGVYDGC